MSTPTAGAEQIEVKKSRKKWPWVLGGVVVVAAVAATTLSVAASGTETKVFGDEVVVALNPGATPAVAIVDFVAENIAPELGLTITTRYFDDYTEINRATDSGEVTASYAQNAPFLSDQITAFDFTIESVGGGAQFSAGVFSSKYASLGEIEDGATLSLRDDPAGQARGVLALSDLGLVTLNPDAGDLPQLSDIALNPKHLDFKPVAIGALGRSFEDVDLIAGYYADVAAAVPTDDIIGYGDVREGWEQLLVFNTDHKNDPGIQKLIKAFTDPRIAEWIETNPDENFRIVLGQQSLGPVAKN